MRTLIAVFAEEPVQKNSGRALRHLYLEQIGLIEKTNKVYLRRKSPLLVKWEFM